MTSEQKQILFKGAATLASFAFAATGADLVGTTLFPVFQGLAVNVASQFGMELFMPYIIKRWLSHSEQVVNDHIQRALVASIHAALAEIETDYLNCDDVSPHEAQSLRDFFAVLRDRSQMEYVEATRDELGRQEVLNYVHDRAATTQHLQDRLRIQLDATSDEFYFTDRFITFFPNRFTELVQFHFKEQLKGNTDDQEKAKKAMDLLFFDTLNAGLLELKEGQQDLRQLLDGALQTGIQTLQQVEFYGEIWISAIRQNRAQLDRIEENTNEAVQLLRTDVATKADVAEIRNDIHRLYSQSVTPGLLLSEQFQQLAQAVRETDLAFTEAQTKLTNAENSLTALQTTIATNPTLAETLSITLNQQQQGMSEAQTRVLAVNTEQQQAKQKLSDFLQQVANTQKAIIEATSHRADQARQLFEQGLFTEANAALDADELRRDKADLLLQRDTVQRQLEQLAQDFILKANMIVLAKKFDWFAQARRLFEEAVEVNQTYGTYYNLAYFLTNHNQHSDAILCFEQASRLAHTAVEKSDTLNHLANLYSDTARPEEAKVAYDEALYVYRQLAEQNPVTYLHDVAQTLNNLGNLYKRTTRPQQAEVAYDESLSIYRQLAEQDPNAYLFYVSRTLNNLAGLYYITDRPQYAEAANDEALSIRRRLAKQNPAAYLPNLAATLNNMAIFYRNSARPVEAEAAYDEALYIYRQLTEQNPATYLPKVAAVINNLAVLYGNTDRFQQAEAALVEALRIRRQLAEQNPVTYLPDVAETLNNLANLYLDTARPEEAETAYDEALQIGLDLARRQPDSYAIDVAGIAVNMSFMYLKLRPEPARDKSINLALATIDWVLPYVERVHDAGKFFQQAVDVCEHWGIDWQIELQKRKDELIKQGFLFIPPLTP